MDQLGVGSDTEESTDSSDDIEEDISTEDIDTAFDPEAEAVKLLPVRTTTTIRPIYDDQIRLSQPHFPPRRLPPATKLMAHSAGAIPKQFP